MTEPGTPAPDLAALFSETRRVSSQVDEVQKSLKAITASIRQHTSEPRSSTRLASRRKARGKGSSESAALTKAISGLNEAYEKIDSLRITTETLTTLLSKLSRESRAHAKQDGSPVMHNAMDQEPEGQEVQRDETPAHTPNASSGPSSRRSQDDTLHGLTRFAGHARRKQAVVDSSLPRLRSGSHEQAVPASNAATGPEAINNAAQQPQAQLADGHDEGSPRSPPPRDRGTAKQDTNAAAQGASTHQRRDADPDSDEAPANTPADNAATRIETSRDPSSDGSDDDTPMQEAEDSLGSSRQAAAANSRSDPSGEQEHDPDTLMTGAEQPCDRQDLAKGAAKATGVTSPQSPNDSISNREDTANTQIGASLPSGTTAQPTQSLATLSPSRQDNDAHINVQDKAHDTTPQGSDTTEDTSRLTTPDTHLTSPDASALSSPSKFVISAADMGEGLVQVLDKFMSDPSFANQVSVPLPGIDPTEIQKGLDVDYTHCQHTGVRFEAGPKAEGYANIFVSEDRHRLDWSKFRPGPVQEPTVEEAEEILDRFINNPPDHTIPYIIGHLRHSPFSKALNPGPTILGDPGLKDLHHEYHHIGLDGSANRFHQEDGTWEDESDGSHGLCSYNEVYYGFKLWVIVQVHHISKFRDWAQATWNCANCSQGLSHQCLLIAPATLKRAGIDFRIVVSKPGEAVVTQPGQQHEIVNYGPCAARSMNFTRSGEKIQFQKVAYCKEDNMAPVYALHGAKRINPPRTALPLAAPASKRRKSTKRSEMADAVPRRSKRVKSGQDNDRSVDKPQVTLESLQELVDKFRAENLLYKVPTLHADQLPTERVLRLACAMSSQLAIKQFHSMVQSWNGRCRLFEQTSLPKDPISRIEHRASLVKKCGSINTLSSYLLSQSQFDLVKEVEAYRQGQLRTDFSFIEKVLERTGWTRENYKYHCKRGRAWVATCGRKEGLLVFVHHCTDLFNTSPTLFLDLAEDELDSLYSLLDNDFWQALLKAGVALQQAVEVSRSVRLAWDGHEVDWDGLDEDKLMLYLEVVDV